MKKFKTLVFASLAVVLVMAFGGVALAGEACATTAKPKITVIRAATGKIVIKQDSTYKLKTKSAEAKLTYKTSKRKVCKVNKYGKLKAKKCGKATIIIKAKKNGLASTKKIKVTVVGKSKYKKVKKIGIKGPKTISAGYSAKLKVAFNPSNASNKNVTYKSSNTSAATVSATGKVTAIKTGKAKITATSCDGSKKATFNLVVSKHEHEWIDHQIILKNHHVLIAGYCLCRCGQRFTDDDLWSEHDDDTGVTHSWMSDIVYDEIYDYEPGYRICKSCGLKKVYWEIEDEYVTMGYYQCSCGDAFINYNDCIDHVNFWPGHTYTEESGIMFVNLSNYLEKNNSTDVISEDGRSGICGTCKWKLDDDGKLTIEPVNGETGTLSDYTKISTWDQLGAVPWYDVRKEIKQIEFKGRVIATTCKRMFLGCSNLESVDFSGLDTSEVTDMSYMLLGAESVKSIDFTPLDTSKVTDMKFIFSCCYKLTDLNVSGIDTSKVVNMSSMFRGDYRFINLDLSSFDTSNVEFMDCMFSDCNNLESVNLSSFDTSNVTIMRRMFYYCRDMESVDLSSFDTSKVEHFEMMFNECHNLKTLDLSSFDVFDSADIQQMFANSEKLTTIYVGENCSDWTNVSKAYETFDKCVSIVGGNGTVYDSNKISKEYARVDAEGTPGYFTLKK